MKCRPKATHPQHVSFDQLCDEHKEPASVPESGTPRGREAPGQAGSHYHPPLLLPCCKPLQFQKAATSEHSASPPGSGPLTMV